MPCGSFGIGARRALVAAALITASVAASGSDEGSDPSLDDSKSLRALEALPPRPLNQRPVVAIYEFRSGVQTVTNTAATDMFVAALLKSRQFRVVERAQADRNVMVEKQLNNSHGITTGSTAEQKLRGAQYIFDGAISEAGTSTAQKQGGLNIGGLRLGGGHNTSTLAVDVRVLDADTGEVLDSVSARKELDDKGAGIGGTASFIGTLASMSGKTASPLTPDVSYQQGKNESVDRALQTCINSTVLKLVSSIPPLADNAAAAHSSSPGAP